MYFKFRVRGPYATALSKLILDTDNYLVDLSDQLAQRLGLPQRKNEVPNATIKVSDDDGDALVIIGKRDAVETALKIFKTGIPYISYELNIYGPYTTVMAKTLGTKDNTCVAEFHNMLLLLQNSRSCDENTDVMVYIVKPATLRNTVAVAFKGIAIIKDTLVLLADGMGRVFFSEHIKDYKRKAELLALSNNIARQGYSIRWRSSAKNAQLEKIAKDLEEALEELKKISSRSYSVGDVVAEGEAIAFVRLSRPSKEYLDGVRNSVVPTALGTTS